MLQPGLIRLQGGRERDLFRPLCLGLIPLLFILLSADWAWAGTAWKEGGKFSVALGAAAQQEQGSADNPPLQAAILPLPAARKGPEAQAQAQPELAERAGEQAPQPPQNSSRQDVQQGVEARQPTETAELAAKSPTVAAQPPEGAGAAPVTRRDSGSNFAKQSRPEQIAPILLAEATQTKSSPGQPPQGAAANGDKAQQEAPRPSGVRLFGTVEFRGVLKNMPKWERVLEEERRSPSFDRDLSKVMRPAVFEQWKNMVQRVGKASTMEKLKAVNVFFNRWPYRIDRDVYGIEDYWATPYEFMKNSGDCEDYAMAKFFALKKLGVPVDSMRIVALIDKIRNIGHAVLVVYVDGDAYILDNLTDLVLSHERFKQYAPQYSVNEEYRWAHVMPSNKR